MAACAPLGVCLLLALQLHRRHFPLLGLCGGKSSAGHSPSHLWLWACPSEVNAPTENVTYAPQSHVHITHWQSFKAAHMLFNEGPQFPPSKATAAPQPWPKQPWGGVERGRSGTTTTRRRTDWVLSATTADTST